VRSHSGATKPAQGDYSKAKKILGWEPKVTYKELFKIMVEHDLKHASNKELRD
jgi:GDPmannose 4,6-dehydratase